MFVPFAVPLPRPGQIDDTDLLDSCRVAGDAVPIFVRLGKFFEDANRVEIDNKISEVFHQNGVEVSVRVQRTYTILLFFTLQVTQVCIIQYMTLCMHMLCALLNKRGKGVVQTYQTPTGYGPQ